MPTAAQILERLTRDAAESGDRGRCRHIRLGRGVLRELAGWLGEAHPGQVDILLADEHTWEAAGADVELALRGAGRVTRKIVLEPRPGEPHLVCEDGVIEAMTTFLSASERMNPVAIGSGTVNDVVKAACHRVGRPFQVVPTAASMNGYTSSIAAVLSDGVKRTSATRQAEAIFADVDVIRAAPQVMNRAGFGDLLSKPYSHADWLLSHLVRGVDYSREAAEVLDEPWQRMLERADGIGRGEPEAIEVLMETILVSGFSMALAGTSAPASGGEHLVSHYWDMEAHCQGDPVRALHGTQVGIGTLLSGLLIERLLRLEADAIDPEGAAERVPDGSWVGAIDPLHPQLTPPVLAEVKQQIAIKQRTGAELAAELHSVRDRWDDIRARLSEVLIPPARVARALAEAGCADRASDLDVPLEHLVRTLRVCRHIRTRYVALDLIADLGLLDTWAADVARLTEAREVA